MAEQYLTGDKFTHVL